MRKALVVAAIAALTVIAQVIPASAALVPPTPADGSTVQGTLSLFENGANSGGVLLGLCNGTTTIVVTGPAGVTGLPSISVGGSGGAAGPSASLTWITDNFKNGAYTITGTGKKYTSICLSSSTTTTKANVTVNNVASLSYGGAIAAPTGTSVTVKATLLDQANVAPATGTVVTFALPGGNTVTATTNSAGVAQTTLAVTGVPRTVNLAVSAPATFFTAASTSASFTVQPDPTTTAVTSTLNPSIFGQSVTFGANVSTSISGVGTPTGSVQFKIDGTNFGTPVTVVAGHADSAATTTTVAGPHAVTAVFTPTGNFDTSTGSLSQVVNKASTTTSVSGSPSPSVFGQAVTFSAHVAVNAPGTGVPDGAVTFQQNGQPIGGPVTVDSSGNATSDPISVLFASTTPYTITATYQGSANYSTSTITTTQTVNKADTGITVSSSSAPSVSGQAVTFSSTVGAVAPGAGTPTGTVTYTVDGNALGSPVALSGSGQGASDPIADLLPGNHTIGIAYSGDANFNATTETFVQEVDQAQTTTAVSSSSDPSVFGQGVTFSAHVTVVAPGAGTPTGTVTFTVDGNPIGSPVGIDASGNATSDPIASLVVGDHPVVATYSGDVAFAGSTDGLVQSVNKAATSATLTSSVTPSVFGQGVTFTADVAVTAPGVGTPTGTISFFDGTTLLGTVPATSAPGTAEASLTTSGLSVGSHAVSAEYSGDDSFLGSNAATNQVVNKASSTTALTQNGPIVQGQPVTFTAAVAYVAPGAGTPTGTVQFKLNGAAQGSPVTLDGSGGATSAPISGLTPGGYTITAVYSGDGNVLPSVGHIGQVVQAASTTLDLVTSGSPSAYGVGVTLLATLNVDGASVGTPTGTVDFYDGPFLLGAVDLVDAGGGPQASMSVPAFAVGHHSLTAVYLGEADYLGSTSALVDQLVSGVATTTAVSSTPNPSVYTGQVTIRATITPAVSNPNPVSGTVSFFDGATLLGTVPVTAASGLGSASISTSTLTAGSHPIKAVYSGDPVYGTSTSSVSTHTVTKQPTSLVVTKSGSQVITGVLSTPNGPFAGQTLVFSAGPTTLCTATTDATGTATCAAGSHSGQIPLYGYQVNYAGDANHVAASFSNRP